MVEERTRERIRGFCAQLRACGIDVFLFSGDMGLIEGHQAEMQKQIETADAVIICYSENFDNEGRSYRHQAVRIAQEEQRKRPPGNAYLITVNLDECPVPPYLSEARVPNYFRKEHFEGIMRWGLAVRRNQLIKKGEKIREFNYHLPQQEHEIEATITQDKGHDMSFTRVAVLTEPQEMKGEVGGQAREKTLRVFCCYARKDQPGWLELKNRLIPLQRDGLISICADINISPGEEWEQKINHYLNTAHIILLLISPDFIASEYCYSKEMTQALERHNKGEAHVIPILLRPVNLQRMPFGKIQSLPTNAKPIKKWANRDDAFLNVANGIESVIEKLLS